MQAQMRAMYPELAELQKAVARLRTDIAQLLEQRRAGMFHVAHSPDRSRDTAPNTASMAALRRERARRSFGTPPSRRDDRDAAP